MLFTFRDVATDTTIVGKELHLHNGVTNNVKIAVKTIANRVSFNFS